VAAYARFSSGVNTAVLPLEVTAPCTAPDSPVRVKVSSVMLAEDITAEKVTDTGASTLTFPAPLAGDTEHRVGDPASPGSKAATNPVAPTA
jgi:hypothetical protein